MRFQINNSLITVAIGIIVHENSILLIKRVRGDYIGYYALPGGKIEKNEHMHSALEREIQEETGLVCKFDKLLGVASEFLVENNQIKRHFLLNICKVKLPEKPLEIKDKKDEGDILWISLSKIKDYKNKIIESDYKFIEIFALNELKHNENLAYFSCEIEKIGDKFLLKKFENYI